MEFKEDNMDGDVRDLTAIYLLWNIPRIPSRFTKPGQRRFSPIQQFFPLIRLGKFFNGLVSLFDQPLHIFIEV